MPIFDIAALRLEAQGIAHPATTTPAEIVTRLGALQAQDYAGALWSIGLRIAGATRADVEQAIADRTIVRSWPMRGTLHFVPGVDARWMLELLTPRIIAGAAGRHRQLEPVPRLTMEGMLCYGPHAEKPPTFVLFDEWIATSRRLERDVALQTIAERFFDGHGPASLRDFAGWTGLAMADARLALRLAQPSLERLMSDDLELWMSATATSITGSPGAHLLPGFDEFMLGYKDRSAALAPRYAERIVPGGNGMFLSTLVLDGQVCGTWRRAARAKSVTLEASPFRALKATEKKAFAAPVERYAHYLGVPVTLAWQA